MRAFTEYEQADLFFNDLYDRGERQTKPASPAAVRQVPEGPGRLFDRIVHQGTSVAEVFLDDESLSPEPWDVVALPRSSTPPDDLRRGDLVVRRALGEGQLATVSVVGEDVEPQSLYGADGLIRTDTLVLRENRPDTPPAGLAVDESDVPAFEDVTSVVGSPRRTRAEWLQAANTGFLGKLPERTESRKGSDVLASVMVPASDPKDWNGNVKAREARDETFLKEILKGNVPRFLRKGKIITVTFTGKDKAEHTIHYQVMKDYLMVGNNRDHVIVPLIPATAQRIADKLGCILPTKKMVDQIFAVAPVKLDALTRDYWMQGQKDASGKRVPKYDPTKDKKLVTHEYDEHLKKSDCQASTAAYLEHNLAISKQLKDAESIERSNDMPLVAGHKKDLVINKNPRKDRLQAYGWFKVTKKDDGTKVGKPIQDFVETAHEPKYVDYSHAARMVAGTMLVDGREMTAAEVLAHDVFAWGISSEGPIANPRVPNVPVPSSSESMEVATDVRKQPGTLTMPAIASPPSFQIVSAFGKPMPNARWWVYQNDAVYKGGVLPDGSTGPIDPASGKFDPAQPFRLHVEGCVCSIVSGAALQVDDSSVEYGGQFVNWRHADDQDFAKRSGFWSQYEKARKLREPLGVFSLLQHDHVMRRPVKLLARHTRAVFEARILAIRLGPIVRYVDARRALIWLELETPGLVRVMYGKATNQTTLPGERDVPASPHDRFATTVRVGGRHYALVWLEELEADTVYQYTIVLAPQPAVGPLPIEQGEFTEAVFPRAPMYGGPSTQMNTLTLASLNRSSWLFLRTAPNKPDTLRFAHGSCRKWPGDHDAAKTVPGPDMLDVFGDSWLGSNRWADWPRFFLHTGDQIYADDVGVKMGRAILRHRFASVVPGPKPANDADIAFGAWAGRFGRRYAPLAQAAPPATNLDQLRAIDPRAKSDTSHDIKYPIALAVRARAQAEFSRGSGTVPLHFSHRVLNGLLWEVPDSEDQVPRVSRQRGLLARKVYRLEGPPERTFEIEHSSAGDTEGVHAADYAEYAALYEQAWSRQGTSRVLAHVPSFMIFDDHEVTDDWNADPAWLEIVHSKRDPFRYWPTTMTDALCAYWVYQGWGNLAPEQWAADPRVQILERCRKAGRDALPELRRLVAARAIDTTAPRTKPANKLDWHFTLPTGEVPFLAVDLRTDRDVNGSGAMSSARLRWIEQTIAQSKSPVAFLVLPVPYLMPDPMLFAFRHPGFVARMAGSRSKVAFVRGSDIEHPAGNPVWDQLKGLLTRLQQSSLKTLVIISGDIHFSCNLDGQLPGSPRTPRLVQLVSSGLRQAISKTKRNQLFSAYKGWLNVISGATGVDEHRGVRMTLGGLRSAGGELSNFLFRTSLAIVNVNLARSPRGGSRVPVPLIQQTHLALDQNRQLTAYSFMHLTQPDGRGLMTLKDPGMGHPAGPKDYPVAHDGVGVTRELDEAYIEEALESAAEIGEGFSSSGGCRYV